MINTLVSINPDLASSIALRYACQLAKLTGMVLQAMHVVEPEQEGDTPGTGWVRRTWEKGLLETARVEIARLINAERASCPALGAPKMRIGVCEDEILRELEEGYYGLYVEGALHSFDSAGFQKKIRSKLYRDSPCPILLVKNLVSPKRIVLILEDEEGLRPLVSTFLKIFEGTEIEVDLLHCKFQSAGRPGFGKREEDDSFLGREESDETLNTAKESLGEAGWTPNRCRLLQDTPVNIAASLQDYGLVVSSISGQKAMKGPLLELLSRVPSAILLCRQ